MRCERAARAQRFEVDVGALGRERLHGLLPDAFRAQRLHLAGGDDLLHELERFGRDREAERREARGEARHAQHAQRVLAERRRNVAQHAGRKIGSSRPRIDELAVFGARDGVDREVASLEIVFERHRRRGIEREARVSRRGLTLRACERVLFAGLRVQEHRKVLADAPEAQGRELIGRRADDDPIALLDGQAEQCVTDCAADLVDSHAGIIP